MSGAAKTDDVIRVVLVMVVGSENRPARCLIAMDNRVFGQMMTSARGDDSKAGIDLFDELSSARRLASVMRHLYGAGGNSFKAMVFKIDPTKPIGPFKDSWDTARETAEVYIRFHDLRHTLVTRMLEGGVPLSVVASILGWSPATTARMAKHYGHIGQLAQRQAVAVMDAKPKKRRQKKQAKEPEHKIATTQIDRDGPISKSI